MPCAGPLKVDLKQLRETQRGIGGIHEVYGQVYRELGLQRLLPAYRYRASSQALYQCVMARIANPKSKRAHLAISFMVLLCVRHLVYRVGFRTRLSAEVIRNALLHVQYSVLEQVGTKHRYVIPSRVSREAVKVYQAMGLKHSQVPTKLED